MENAREINADARSGAEQKKSCRSFNFLTPPLFLRTSGIVHLAALAALAVMLHSAYIIRAQDIANNAGAQNLQTPWHVLQTLKAYSETPARRHFFLPIVTLGGANDRGVPWGATIPDEGGYYYYTSATSPTFFLPYLWLNFFHLSPSIQSLAEFNFILQIASGLLLYALIFRLLRVVNVTSLIAATSSVAAAAIAFFSREALLSFGVVYWFHGLFIITMLLTLWVTLEICTASTASGLLLFLLADACFADAWVDWSGFVFNVGAAVVLLAFEPSRRTVRVVLSMAAGTFSAGLVILVHYAAVLRADTVISAMMGRFAARSANAGEGFFANVLALGQGYVLSFGVFLVVLVVCGFSVARAKVKSDARRLILLMIVLAAIPLVQNLVLMENSAEYSYERLKFVVPAAMVIAVAFAFSNPARRIGLAAVIAGSSVFGVWAYKEDMLYYARWSEVDAANRKFRDAVVSQPEFGCAILVTNAMTRGYSTLLFDRMIYERAPFNVLLGRHIWMFESAVIDYVREEMMRSGACAGILLVGQERESYSPRFAALPEYTAAIIVNGFGPPRVVPADRIPRDQEMKSLFVRMFSYGASRY